jgi:enterochelin esterase-like enzyme
MLILSFFLMLLFVGCSTEEPPKIPDQLSPTMATKTIQPFNTSTAVDNTPEDQLLTTPTPDCLLADSTVEEQSFFSDLLETDFFYKVYLPPCYEEKPDHQYPTLYLLHGLSYDNQQWIRLGLKESMDDLIQNDKIHSFIIILPTESRFDPPERSLYGDALVNELIPEVENQYRTLNDKSYRGIGGLSRGAAWAVRIGFEHYDHFGKVGAHSLPLFQAETWLTQNPKEELPSFFIDIGRDDSEWQSAQAFANLLNQNGVPHEWYLFTGGHSEEYWSAHLEQYLLWYGKDW